MFRSRIRALAAVIMVGAMLSIPAVSASGSSADSLSSSASAAQHQKFILLQTDPNVEGGTVVGFGAIHAKGVFVFINEFKDKFKFPEGNLVIKHKPKEDSIRESYDPVNCYFHFSERGTWKVVKATGAYADWTGGGTYKVEGHGVGCEEDAPPEEFALMVTAVGELAP